MQSGRQSKGAETCMGAEEVEVMRVVCSPGRLILKERGKEEVREQSHLLKGGYNVRICK